MSYIIDIILIALIVFVVVSSKKKGFVASLLESLSLIISTAFSYFLTPRISDFLYENVVSGIVRNKFENALAQNVPQKASAATKVTELTNTIPSFAVKLAGFVGVDLNELSRAASTGKNVSTDEIISVVMDKVAYAVLIVAIKALVFIVLFIVLALLIKSLTKIIGKIANKLPIVGKVNKLLGAALGVIKAIILVFVICTVLYFIAGASNGSSFTEIIESSKIYGFVSGINPVINFLN